MTETEGEDPVVLLLIQLEDATFTTLKGCLLVSGRGRPPQVPNLPCTNKVLLQLYAIKTRNHKTWDDLEGWMRKLYPLYPSSRWKRLIEKTLSTALKTKDKSLFFSEVIDLDCIGPMCKDVGITRRTFSDLCPDDLKRDVITRGILLELYQAYDQDLYSCVNHICPGVYTAHTIKSELKMSRTMFSKLNKSKSRGDASKAYVNEKILVPQKENGCTASVGKDDNCTPEKEPLRPSNKGNVNSKDDIQFKQPCKQAPDSEIENMRAVIEGLREVCASKMQEIKSLEECAAASLKTLDEKEIRIRLLQREVNVTKKLIRTKNAEISNFKSGARYKYVKRRESLLLEKEKGLGRKKNLLCEKEVASLKTKEKDLQRKLSAQKVKASRCMNENKTAQQEVVQAKQEYVALEAEYSFFASQEMSMREDGIGRPYNEQVEKCVMELCCEYDVSSEKVSGVISTVCKWLFDKKVDKSDLPSASTAVNIIDRAHVLARFQLTESMMGTEKWDLHGDGTSRDGKKIIGHQVTLNSGQTMSLGFNNVATEDSTTLLDNCISLIEEISDVYGEEDRDRVFNAILAKMFAAMSDRSSVNKLFNTKLSAFIQEKLGEETIDTKFLYCNAHYLLGLSNAAESVLKTFQKELESQSEQRLGRDSSPKFSRFGSAGESAAARYIRTACDVFGPRGDQKNGCQQDWQAYCQEIVGENSLVSSFRMNRFNNFFCGAAFLYYHQKDIVDFLSNFEKNLNLKLESVLLDSKSEEVHTLVRAIGILYFVVTGPFWNLLNSDTNYADQYKYIQEMYAKFQEFSQDSSDLLLRPESFFPEYKVTNDKVLKRLCSQNVRSDITKLALERIFQSFITVTDRQLSDFLPGGLYGHAPDEETRKAMEHCKLTNLVSEHEFGDLDYSQFKRRNASMHFHSSVQMVKRNKTISSWLSSKSSDDQSSLLKMAKDKSKPLRLKHCMAEREVLSKTREKLEEVSRKKKEKEAARKSMTERLVSAVIGQGGPCSNEQDLSMVLNQCASTNKKLEALKNEIRYLKVVLGIKDQRLVFGGKSLETLKADYLQVLNSEKISLHICKGLNKKQADTNDKRKNSTDNKGNEQKKQRKNACDAAANEGTSNIGDLYRFNKQGVWVAVAYDQSWFVGQTLALESEQTATVQFLSKGMKNFYKWPRIDDIDKIDCQFVFAHDFTVKSNNGRVWEIPDQLYLEELYQNYCQIYFE